MYTPSSFEETDPDKLLDFVARYPFATVVTPAAGDLCVSHLPLLARRRADRVVLIGHVARANAHWRAFDRGPTTAIFHGPHAYVSPAWYATALSVPTWNYAVVHATGQVRVEDDRKVVAAQLRDLTEIFEGRWDGAWSPSILPEDLAATKLQAIVGFELAVDRLEGKFKLGQNRSEEDRRGVIARLEGATSDRSRDLAALMRQTLGTVD